MKSLRGNVRQPELVRELNIELKHERTLEVSKETRFGTLYRGKYLDLLCECGCEDYLEYPIQVIEGPHRYAKIQVQPCKKRPDIYSDD